MKHCLVIFALTLLSCASASAEVQPLWVKPVVQSYRDFAFEVVLDIPSQEAGFIDQPDRVLRRYLSDKLARSIRLDRECTKRTGELGRLDFTPLWDSQDPEAVNLRVVPGGKPGLVDVTFAGPRTGRKTTLQYVVREFKGLWRIDDIRYADGRSLRALLDAGQPCRNLAERNEKLGAGTDTTKLGNR